MPGSMMTGAEAAAKALSGDVLAELQVAIAGHLAEISTIVGEFSRGGKR
jgi:hypothetical protein